MAKKRNRHPDHLKSQKQVKIVENSICIVCCETRPEKAHGHHLIPYSEGGSSDLGNFLTLCRDCHVEYHAGKLNIDIIRF